VRFSDGDKIIPEHLLGKPFGAKGLPVVKQEIDSCPCACRAELARRDCIRLNWRSAGGAWQFMSARVGLLRLHRAGLIQLPKARNGNGNGQPLSEPLSAPVFQNPVHLRADLIPGFFLQRVGTPELSSTYNGLIDQHHYLGYTPLAGSQLRYLIGWTEGWLGAISFGASAWSVAARDQYIGWGPQERKDRLHLIVNNSRFLIAPWVRSSNLASRILGLCARRLPCDFQEIYGYAPVLLETFVEEGRFDGACYRAANWRCIGQTQGRGKKGQRHEARVARKRVWVYPLHRNFRAVLKGEQTWL